MLKFLIIVLFLAILASLARGFFGLMKDKGDSKRVVNALTWRIALSILLFVLLFVAWAGGLIQPHGVVPVPGPR